MFQKFFEFYHEIYCIIFELILSPPITPPERMQRQLFSESYILFAKKSVTGFICKEISPKSILY